MRLPFYACHARGMALRSLIVDDNVEYLRTARTILEQDGIDVVGVATSSTEARQLVSELRPSLVLVDVYLGEESGLELARQLAGHAGAEPVVILISTYSETDLAELAATTSAVAFLSKAQLSGRAIREAVGLTDDE
jgi:CheY-like chemotaxis protein